MIDKVISYEASQGSWRQRVLMTADDPDWAGHFHRSSDSAAEHVGVDYTISTVKVGLVPMSEATEAMVNGMNNGAYLINFVGHGSPSSLGGGQLRDD